MNKTTQSLIIIVGVTIAAIIGIGAAIGTLAIVQKILYTEIEEVVFVEVSEDGWRRKVKQCGSAVRQYPDGSMKCYYLDWQLKEIKQYGSTGVKPRKEVH